jgi:hypothetical protein
MECEKVEAKKDTRTSDIELLSSNENLKQVVRLIVDKWTRSLY